jgi:hypothetical protein
VALFDIGTDSPEARRAELGPMHFRTHAIMGAHPLILPTKSGNNWLAFDVDSLPGTV